MGDNSKIEWTDATWNPTRGCSKVSEGCRNCYAMRVAHRFSGPGQPYEGLTRVVPGKGPQWTGVVRTVPEALNLPLRWRKPRRVFVDSMSDLFHEGVPFDFVDQVFAAMAIASRHTYQVLTKRPSRMAEYLAGLGTPAGYGRLEAAARSMGYTLRFEGIPLVPWPLPSVWLGTSVENQAAADERIPHLHRCPAAVRFLSCEPLLGPVDLSRYLLAPRHEGRCACRGAHWVIAGGESGPGHRQVSPEWVRSLRDQCLAADVAFLFKQWGGHSPKAGGRELDGRTWDEYPERAAIGDGHG